MSMRKNRNTYTCMQWEQWLGTYIFTTGPSFLSLFCASLCSLQSICSTETASTVEHDNCFAKLVHRIQTNGLKPFMFITLITTWKSNGEIVNCTVLWNLLTLYHFYVWAPNMHRATDRVIHRERVQEIYIDFIWSLITHLFCICSIPCLKKLKLKTSVKCQFNHSDIMRQYNIQCIKSIADHHLSFSCAPIHLTIWILNYFLILTEIFFRLIDWILCSIVLWCLLNVSVPSGITVQAICCSNPNFVFMSLFNYLLKCTFN